MNYLFLALWLICCSAQSQLIGHSGLQDIYSCYNTVLTQVSLALKLDILKLSLTYDSGWLLYEKAALVVQLINMGKNIWCSMK